MGPDPLEGREVLDIAEPAPEPLPLEGARAIEIDEPCGKRIGFLCLALLTAAGYCFFLLSFLAPAPGRPGIDENAYLVAGRQIAEHATTGMHPSDDYQFVGAMWVRAADGWYYPKYPFGRPLLDAIPVLLSHPQWAFYTSPLCMSLAALGMFFLARAIAGSFYALLAMIVLAMGPTSLQLADMPNSHAPSLCFVVWGMYFLHRWWRRGGIATGIAAGLLLGFAVTIRYTEALLIFPLYPLKLLHAEQWGGPWVGWIFKLLAYLPVGAIGAAALARLKRRSRADLLRAAVPILAWALPVGALVIFNYFTLGRFSGYDQTNESSGFSISYFLAKWDFTVYQLYLFGLFFVLPLGLLGLMLMWPARRREALLLSLWFFPGVFLYTAYYWGQNTPSVAFLRFFLTLYPPLIIAAMWLLRSASGAADRPIAGPLAAGVLTAIAACVGLSGSLGELERQHRGTLNLHYSARRMLANVEPSAGGRPMILADAGMFPQLLQYMQYMLDADWYPSDVFAARAGGGFGLAGIFQRASASTSDAPVLLQQDRIDYIDSVRKGKTDADFIHDAQDLMHKALAAQRRVYVVLPPEQADAFRRRYIDASLKWVELERWVEPVAVRFPSAGEQKPLELPIWGDNGIIPWHPQRRAMFEVRQ
jgi:hypothetical protein